MLAHLVNAHHASISLWLQNMNALPAGMSLLFLSSCPLLMDSHQLNCLLPPFETQFHLLVLPPDSPDSGPTPACRPDLLQIIHREVLSNDSDNKVNNLFTLKRFKSQLQRPDSDDNAHKPLPEVPHILTVINPSIQAVSLSQRSFLQPFLSTRTTFLSLSLATTSNTSPHHQDNPSIANRECAADNGSILPLLSPCCLHSSSSNTGHRSQAATSQVHIGNTHHNDSASPSSPPHLLCSSSSRISQVNDGSHHNAKAQQRYGTYW